MFTSSYAAPHALLFEGGLRFKVLFARDFALTGCALTPTERGHSVGDVTGFLKRAVALLTAVHYLKDNRLLPDGFDKRTADAEIAVVGDALNDPAFTGGGHRVRYSATLGTATGPFTIEAELWYQPIGYRWANNLKPYAHAAELRRFNNYFESMKSGTAAVLARANFNTVARP